MFSVGLQWITGMMIGIEFPDKEDLPPEVSFGFVVDLLIVRAVFMFERPPPTKPA